MASPWFILPLLLLLSLALSNILTKGLLSPNNGVEGPPQRHQEEMAFMATLCDLAVSTNFWGLSWRPQYKGSGHAARGGSLRSMQRPASWAQASTQTASCSPSPQVHGRSGGTTLSPGRGHKRAGAGGVGRRIAAGGQQQLDVCFCSRQQDSASHGRYQALGCRRAVIQPAVPAGPPSFFQSF